MSKEFDFESFKKSMKSAGYDFFHIIHCKGSVPKILVNEYRVDKKSGKTLLTSICDQYGISSGDGGAFDQSIKSDLGKQYLGVYHLND